MQKVFILFLLLSMWSLTIYGQSKATQPLALPVTAQLKMLKDSHGGTLRIQIDSAGKSKTYFVDWGSEPVTRLSDAIKLQLIDSLLTYEYDTTLSWRGTYRLDPRIRGLREPKQKHYRIQVGALLLINLLAFGDAVFSYSGFPVICDIATGAELADQVTISKAYSVYRKWYAQLKHQNFRSFGYPPLQEKGLKWFWYELKPEVFPSPGGWSGYYKPILFEDL